MVDKAMSHGVSHARCSVPSFHHCRTVSWLLSRPSSLLHLQRPPVHRPGGPSEAVSRAELSHAPALAALASKSSAASAPAIAARVRSQPSWPGGHRPVEEVVEVVHSVACHCRQQQAPRRQVVASSVVVSLRGHSNRCGPRGTLVAPAPGLHHIHSAPGARRPRHAVRLSRGTPSTTAPSLSLPSSIAVKRPPGQPSSPQG